MSWHVMRALFSQTAVSDVVLMNIYRSDVGRCVAANTRALKAVFTQKLSLIASTEEDALHMRTPLPLLIAVHECDAEADNAALSVSSCIQSMSALPTA